jgi:hypothetical protein
VIVRSAGAQPLAITPHNARRNEGKRRQETDVAFTKTFAIGNLAERRDATEPEVFHPSASLGDGGKQRIAALGTHGGLFGGLVHNALHGDEGRGRPGQRERGRGQFAPGLLVVSVVCGRGRTTQNQADLNGLRSDDHAINMALDQVAVCRVNGKPCCFKVPANAG